MAFTTLILVAIGLGVVGVLAFRRRPAKQWKPYLKRQTKEWVSEDDHAGHPQPVQLRTVSLQEFLRTTAVDGPAYVVAEALPGYEQIDQMAKRLESRQHASKSVKTAAAQSTAR